MKKNRILIILTFLLPSLGLWAQDIHFSQFYNAPLTLNPALTGKINGKFRIGINYRNQWTGAANGTTTFSTPAIAFDMPIKLKSGDFFGVGGYIVNDRSSGGMLSRMQVMASAAFHKGFGKENNHSISLGLQAGIQQRRIDLQKIRFGNQFEIDNDLNYNPNISSGVNIDDNTINFDVNAGLMWNSRFSSKVHAYAGFSLYNIIQPISTFSTDATDFTRRISATGGLDIRVANRFSLLPSVIYMNQAKAQETNVGISGATDITKNFVLFTGIYYRVKDAVIPYLGADYKGFRLGVSYDANASSWNGLDGSDKFDGTFEVSLMYVARLVPIPEVKPALYCPRF
ncbi:MAG: PorP/SprF family type IX secretion system membrane protein [Chitinophagales bacterium]|nr:PorP/SprF family type IX secretion system membrane protein [Chitinophagales bacterium]